MPNRTATPSNVVDITRRLRERAAQEPTPSPVEPTPVVALAPRQGPEAGGRLLREQLMAEAEALFGQVDWTVAQ